MTPADADSTQVLFIVFFVLGEDESYDEPDTDLAAHPPPSDPAVIEEEIRVN